MNWFLRNSLRTSNSQRKETPNSIKLWSIFKLIKFYIWLLPFAKRENSPSPEFVLADNTKTLTGKWSLIPKSFKTVTNIISVINTPKANSVNESSPTLKSAIRNSWKTPTKLRINGKLLPFLNLPFDFPKLIGPPYLSLNNLNRESLIPSIFTNLTANSHNPANCEKTTATFQKILTTLATTMKSIQSHQSKKTIFQILIKGRHPTIQTKCKAKSHHCLNFIQLNKWSDLFISSWKLSIYTTITTSFNTTMNQKSLRSTKHIPIPKSNKNTSDHSANFASQMESNSLKRSLDAVSKLSLSSWQHNKANDTLLIVSSINRKWLSKLKNCFSNNFMSFVLSIKMKYTKIKQYSMKKLFVWYQKFKIPIFSTKFSKISIGLWFPLILLIKQLNIFLIN